MACRSYAYSSYVIFVAYAWWNYNSIVQRIWEILAEELLVRIIAKKELIVPKLTQTVYDQKIMRMIP